jgi:hypothetical protein
VNEWPEIPPVCFDADLCRILDLKLRTLKRRRKTGAFPIPALPSLDRRHRYSRADVIRFLEREAGGRASVFRRKTG